MLYRLRAALSILRIFSYESPRHQYRLEIVRDSLIRGFFRTFVSTAVVISRSFLRLYP